MHRNQHFFKYFEDKEEWLWPHSLELEDYGSANTWVILKKDGDPSE